VGLLLRFTICSFETKRWSTFYFGNGYVFLHQLFVVVLEWPNGKFVGFIS
jgi:hypothetical protein